MLEKSDCVAEPGKPSLLITREFDAAVEDVFNAWTRPEELSQWWDPSGKPLAVCEIDLRVGGAFRWINQGPLGEKFPFSGVYDEIVPNQKLVFRTRISPEKGESRGTLVFAENNGKTTLTLTILYPTVAEREAALGLRIDAGTGRSLQNLAAYLQRTKS